MSRLRFFRRIKLAPGVTLNLSKRGVSTSFGPRGAKVTAGTRGSRTTVGVPGTGLFYTSFGPSPYAPAGRSRGHARTNGRRQQPSGSATNAREALLNRRALEPTVRIPTGPGRWIGWGIFWCVVGLPALAGGPLALPILGFGIFCIGRGWLMKRRPRWVALGLVRKARRIIDHSAAKQMFGDALTVDVDCVPALFDLAQFNFDAGEYRDATDLYRRYLNLAPDHVFARLKLADAYVRLNQPEDAIRELLTIRSDPRLAAVSRASVSAALATAFTMKRDYGQAMELTSAEIGQKRLLDLGQRQCLYARAIASYLIGKKARGIHDLDRLFAIDSAYEGVQEAREAMAAGTFTLDGTTEVPSRAAGPGRATA